MAYSAEAAVEDRLPVLLALRQRLREGPAGLEATALVEPVARNPEVEAAVVAQAAAAQAATVAYVLLHSSLLTLAWTLNRLTLTGRGLSLEQALLP